MHFEERGQLRRQDEEYTKQEKGEEEEQEEEKKRERLYVSTGPDIFAFSLPCLLFPSSDLYVGVLQLSLAGSARGGRGRRAVKVGHACYGPCGLGAAAGRGARAGATCTPSHCKYPTTSTPISSLAQAKRSCAEIIVLAVHLKQPYPSVGECSGTSSLVICGPQTLELAAWSCLLSAASQNPDRCYCCCCCCWH